MVPNEFVVDVLVELLLVVDTFVVTTLDAKVVVVVVGGDICPNRCVSLKRTRPLPSIDTILLTDYSYFNLNQYGSSPWHAAYGSSY